jgi:hypothetical protein
VFRGNVLEAGDYGFKEFQAFLVARGCRKHSDPIDNISVGIISNHLLVDGHSSIRLNAGCPQMEGRQRRPGSLFRLIELEIGGVNPFALLFLGPTPAINHLLKGLSGLLRRTQIDVNGKVGSDFAAVRPGQLNLDPAIQAACPHGAGDSIGQERAEPIL